MDTTDAEDDRLDAAWLALDEGRGEDALALLAQVPDERGERHAAEFYARLEHGDWPAAEVALEKAAARLEDDDPLLLAASGEWQLLHWRVDAARAHFERAADIQRDPSLLERLALCADLGGDFALADRLLDEAQRLDPGGPPAPTRLSADAFEAVVADAAADLPQDFQSALEEIAVVIDPVPSHELVAGGEVAELPPDLLGLFVGHSALDRGHDLSAELPPTIFLFQRNLERACLDPEMLREEIRVTLYHELGHALGFDEEGVEAMGLE